ncbi:DUF3238 domain-containing protein [Paenibacillus thiaminolyticus]|nr:DUF3238 domain-containing protein [Paenibacillus thiaminolyticus]MCY9537582.1 DUF3238 domain-containing protein [Paenibacillus thiaminolyticus]MCY9600695.1 DUF3238 domain-containing protein [Paenibacillus thiaminolyticus]MCY9607523.1 DUF3238 domain-containing protein [Paenibacillus thiaminolyticus]MCY9611323.1 DUF3238 domain-containing protein [Paenibacillus thiaminolyticus]MCY9619386.1 DUF3238 domain-containing protein [Paenibacillus thiaminolyticus]
MAHIVEIRFAAFIPEAWIEHKRTASALIQFNGNNRSFTYFTEDQPELSKMAQHIVVDFEKTKIKHFRSTGPTIERTVELSSGNVLREVFGHASDSGLTISNESISSTSASFFIQGSAANPLNADASPLDWEYDVTVDTTGKVTVKGRHDGFPAHEIYKRVDKGEPVTIYTHDPRVTGDTPLSLLPPMERIVDRIAP